jgi:IS30 family transposase
MAKMLHRNHGVLCREFERNSEPDGTYSSLKAQARADARQSRNKKRSCKLDADPVLRRYIIQELKRNQSPDVIAGILKMHPPPELQGKSVSHETIYRWIYEGNGRHEHLHGYLCSGRRKRRKRYARKMRKAHIPNRISIHERPIIIEERREVGHWETDSMIFSKQRERLSVQYERKAKYVVIHRLSDGTAEATDEALHDAIQSLPQDLWKTLTYDNGGEGTNHSNLQRQYGIQTYFCDPYCSWQKGGVENVNGIIRRHLPRSTDMRNITQRNIYEIQQTINHTPRKSLGYKTPAEVLGEIGGRGVVHC